jgi:hypothetical protein
MDYLDGNSVGHLMGRYGAIFLVVSLKVQASRCLGKRFPSALLPLLALSTHPMFAGS